MTDWCRPPDLLVVGSPRSGTTLVQRLVAQRLGFATGPETHFWNVFAARVGGELSGRMGPDHVRRLVATWLAMPENDGLAPTAGFEGAVRSLGRPLTPLELFALVSRSTVDDASVPLLEKTPGHLPFARALVQAVPSLEVVVVVRAPDRNVESNLRMTFGMDDEQLLLHRWARDAETGLALAREHPDRVSLVRLEDLRAAPETTIDGLRHRGDPAAAPSGDVALARETWKADAMSAVKPVDPSPAAAGPAFWPSAARAARAIGYPAEATVRRRPVALARAVRFDLTRSQQVATAARLV